MDYVGLWIIHSPIEGLPTKLRPHMETRYNFPSSITKIDEELHEAWLSALHDNIIFTYFLVNVGVLIEGIDLLNDNKARKNVWKETRRIGSVDQ